MKAVKRWETILKECPTVLKIIVYDMTCPVKYNGEDRAESIFVTIQATHEEWQKFFPNRYDNVKNANEELARIGEKPLTVSDDPNKWLNNYKEQFKISISSLSEEDKKRLDEMVESLRVKEQ